MKISTKKLRKLIQEELFYREFYGNAKSQRTIKNGRLSESAQRILHDDGKVKVTSSHEDNAGSYIEVYVDGLIASSGDYSVSSNEFQLDSSDAAARPQKFYSLDQLVDFYKNSMMEQHQLSEFWGKKKEQTPRRSDADILEQALQVMTQSTESFPEGNGLNYVIWGPFDDPYDKELMKLGQAFTKRLKEVVAEYRTKEDQRDQE